MIASQARFKFTASKEGDDNAQSKILIVEFHHVYLCVCLCLRM